MSVSFCSFHSVVGLEIEKDSVQRLAPLGNLEFFEVITFV